MALQQLNVDHAFNLHNFTYRFVAENHKWLSSAILDNGRPNGKVYSGSNDQTLPIVNNFLKK